MRRLPTLALALLAMPIAGAAAGIEVTDVMSDGFVIRYHLSETEAYLAPGAGTPHDLVREAIRANYEEFLSWGLRGGWPGEGHVYMDDQASAQCAACVSSRPEFQVHLSALTPVRITATAQVLYPSHEGQVYTTVGHEVFHDFQNARLAPTNSSTRMGSAFMEGLARMQEALHAYSWVSHQPNSLIYIGTVNGCNNELAPAAHPVMFPEASPVQWVPDATLSDGPATAQTYSACSFWLSWYGAHGNEGLVALLEAAPRHAAKDGWMEMRDTIEDATGAPVDDDLARYAATALTGTGLAFNGHDWAEHLGRWQPATLSPGEPLTVSVSDGGMMGAWVEAGAVHVSSDLPTDLILVREDGSWERIASGAHVERAWAVAILPGLGRADVSLSVA